MAPNLEEDIKKRALAGTAWLLLFVGSSQVLRLGSNLILAQLLLPETFGLMALVSVFIGGLHAFSNMGIEASLVRSRHAQDEQYRNSAWTLQILRGLIIWASLFILAPIVAGFYEDPRLTALIRVTGLVAVVDGLRATALPMLLRGFKTKTVAGLRVISYGTGLVVMLVWASVSPTVWALVAGNLTSSCVLTVLSHFKNRGIRDRLAWEPAAIAELYTFGKWLLISGVFVFLANNLDRLLLGKLISVEILGVYYIAFMLAMLPVRVMTILTRHVLFPVFAHYARDSKEVLCAQFANIRSAILPVIVFVTSVIMLGGEIFFTELYGAKYHAAGWMSQLLSVLAWIHLLKLNGDRVFTALGNTRAVAQTNFISFVGRLIGPLIGFLAYGLEGFILGLVVGALLGYAACQYLLAREGIQVFTQDLKFSLMLAIVTGVPLLLVRTVFQLSTTAYLVVAFVMLLLLGSYAAKQALPRILRVVRQSAVQR